MADDTPDEFPVPLQSFIKTLIGTSDEVWSRLLKLSHGMEKHTMSGWSEVLATLRDQGV